MEAIQKIGENWATQLRIEIVGLFEELGWPKVKEMGIVVGLDEIAIEVWECLGDLR